MSMNFATSMDHIYVIKSRQYYCRSSPRPPTLDLPSLTGHTKSGRLISCCYLQIKIQLFFRTTIWLPSLTIAVLHWVSMSHYFYFASRYRRFFRINPVNFSFTTGIFADNDPTRVSQLHALAREQVEVDTPVLITISHTIITGTLIKS